MAEKKTQEDVFVTLNFDLDYNFIHNIVPEFTGITKEEGKQLAENGQEWKSPFDFNIISRGTTLKVSKERADYLTKNGYQVTKNRHSGGTIQTDVNIINKSEATTPHMEHVPFAVLANVVV